MDLSAEDKFGLLPMFWNGVLPSERRVVMTFMQSNKFEYSVKCLTQLDTECFIPYIQMNYLCVCVFISKEHPKSLDFGAPVLTPVNMPTNNDPEEAAQARAEKSSLNEKLDYFQLVPKDTAGNLKY